MPVHNSDHFTYKKLFQITIFPIAMMLFSSLYWIVDGVCLSNFAGDDAFAGVNLAWPFFGILGGLGFMFGTGGAALVSKLLGEKKEKEANETFSLLTYFLIGLGVFVSIVFFFFIEPIMRFMASLSTDATEEMIQDAVIYGRILTLAQPIFMLQYFFHSFMNVAEKQKVALLFTFIGGISNIVLDLLLVGAAGFGVIGAASATVVSYSVGGLGPLIYFIVKKDGIIRLGKPGNNIKNVGRSAYNGLSEFITNIATNVVSIFYNAQLLILYGQAGISAYGMVMYVSFIFFGLFVGYSFGISPAVSYHYGAKNKEELRNILGKSLVIILISSFLMFTLSFVSAKGFSYIFFRSDDELLALSSMCLRIYAFVFIFSGLTIFASSFFTALNNGLVSGLISISRTLLLPILFVYLFPTIFGPTGIWWSLVAAEAAASILSFFLLLGLRHRYGYWNK